MSGEAMSPVPPDHPLMKAWTAYKAGDDYANSYKWATAGIDPPPVKDRDPTANYPTAESYRRYVEGSLWAAFMAGFAAGGDNEIERCAAIVQLAREDEIDRDWRSIIHRIESRTPATAE